MSQNKILVIVESPGKIHKIQQILGDKYIVKASVGHIMDLKPSGLSINIEKDFEPEYEIIKGKEGIVKELRIAFNKSDDVLLATDEDREGEMIAWSIVDQLKIKNPKRIVFNSVTKDELLNAIKKPRDLDYNLIDAQKMRRLLDRIVGYKISSLLWKSVGNYHLSAGRVQSVVVKLIIENENKIKDFYQNETSSFFQFMGVFLENKNEYKSILYTTKKNNNKKNEDEDEEESEFEETIEESQEETESDSVEIKKGSIAKIQKIVDARNIMKLMIKSTFKVSGISERVSIRDPSPPFETSSLQQEASNKLSFTSQRTMMAAQHLYEAGHITYMRTDSVNLSDEAMKKIEQFIKNEYGNKYYQKRIFKSKSKNAQEAHEAIRPTDISNTDIATDTKTKIGSDEIRLYNLIRKRTLACQMSSARFNVIEIQIDISKTDDYYFVSHFEKLIFDGFLKAYDFKNVDQNGEEDKSLSKDILKPTIGKKLDVKNIIGTQDYLKPPSRYNDGSLVKKMKSLDIGRPATYASIINKIQERKYVVKEDIDGIKKESLIMSWNGKNDSPPEETTKEVVIGREKNKFVPTDLGYIVNDFLNKYFVEIMNYQFTALMEDILDQIALGKAKWLNELKKFYNNFQPIIEKVSKLIKPKEIIEQNTRELGTDDKGNKIIASVGHYGPYLKLCDPNDPEKCKTIGKIISPLTLKNITLEEALKMMSYPKILGKHDGKDVSLVKGPFGFYIKYDNMSITLKGKSDEEINDLDIKTAIEMVKTKKESILWQGEDDKNKYTVQIGKWGPYVIVKPIKGKSGFKKKNPFYGLPKDVDVKSLTVEKIKELIEKAIEMKKNRFAKKKEVKSEINNQTTNQTEKQSRPKKVIPKNKETKNEIDNQINNQTKKQSKSKKTIPKNKKSTGQKKTTKTKN